MLKIEGGYLPEQPQDQANKDQQEPRQMPRREMGCRTSLISMVETIPSGFLLLFSVHLGDLSLYSWGCKLVSMFSLTYIF